MSVTFDTCSYLSPRPDQFTGNSLPRPRSNRNDEQLLPSYAPNVYVHTTALKNRPEWGTSVRNHRGREGEGTPVRLRRKFFFKVKLLFDVLNNYRI